MDARSAKEISSFVPFLKAAQPKTCRLAESRTVLAMDLNVNSTNANHAERNRKENNAMQCMNHGSMDATKLVNEEKSRSSSIEPCDLDVGPATLASRSQARHLGGAGIRISHLWETLLSSNRSI